MCKGGSADRRWGIVTLPIHRTTLTRSQSLRPCGAPAYASGPSVAARHLPTLWGVTLYTREALPGEHCSPLRTNINIIQHPKPQPHTIPRGVEDAAPYGPPQSLPCVKGDSPQCGEMSRSDRGARRVSGWHGVSRDGGIGACMGVLGCTRKVAIPQSALPRSQPPLHKGAF